MSLPQQFIHKYEVNYVFKKKRGNFCGTEFSILLSLFLTSSLNHLHFFLIPMPCPVILATHFSDLDVTLISHLNKWFLDLVFCSWALWLLGLLYSTLNFLSITESGLEKCAKIDGQINDQSSDSIVTSHQDTFKQANDLMNN